MNIETRNARVHVDQHCRHRCPCVNFTYLRVKANQGGLRTKNNDGEKSNLRYLVTLILRLFRRLVSKPDSCMPNTKMNLCAAISASISELRSITVPLTMSIACTRAAISTSTSHTAAHPIAVLWRSCMKMANGKMRASFLPRKPTKRFLPVSKALHAKTDVVKHRC